MNNCYANYGSTNARELAAHARRGAREPAGLVTGSASVDFLPSRNGLHFANRFPPGPTIRLGPIDPRWFGVGDASHGLCGGMVFTARDLLARERRAAEGRRAAARTAPLASARSSDARSSRSTGCAYRCDSSTSRPSDRAWAGGAAPDVTLDDEWPRVRAELEAGRPAMLGLIRQASANPFLLGLNHQVMAYAATWDERAIRSGSTTRTGPTATTSCSRSLSVPMGDRPLLPRTPASRSWPSSAPPTPRPSPAPGATGDHRRPRSSPRGPRRRHGGDRPAHPGAGAPTAGWIFVLHGLLAGALLVAVAWKLRRSLGRALAARRWGRIALGLAVTLLAAAALSGGYLWVAAGEIASVGSFTVLTLHAWAGLALVPLVVVHLLPRRWRLLRPGPRPLRRTDLPAFAARGRRPGDRRDRGLGNGCPAREPAWRWTPLHGLAIVAGRDDPAGDDILRRTGTADRRGGLAAPSRVGVALACRAPGRWARRTSPRSSTAPPAGPSRRHGGVCPSRPSSVRPDSPRLPGRSSSGRQPAGRRACRSRRLAVACSPGAWPASPCRPPTVPLCGWSSRAVAGSTG